MDFKRTISRLIHRKAVNDSALSETQKVNVEYKFYGSKREIYKGLSDRN